jgi:Fe-S oxidoreductase
MKKFKCLNNTLDKAVEISEKCTGCRLCMRECLMLNDYCTSPKGLFKDISEKKEVDALVPYSCSMCGKCTMVCPKNLEIGDVFMEMREDIAAQNGDKSPIKGHRTIDMHQTFSFSKMFNTSIPDNKSGYTKRVFIPGCSLSSYKPQLVGKTLNYLQERLPGTGAVLKCCGKPTKDLGQTEKFQERYDSLVKEIKELGATEVITACQNCFVTISKHSPELNVRSLWTVIPEIGIDEEARNIGADSDVTFSVHDACPTRKNSDIHDGIRWIIKELGYDLEESQCSREKTGCCGFGGMALPANPELSKRVMQKSASQSELEHMITYCASCREAMALGGKKAVHILDLMFGKCLTPREDIGEMPGSSLQNWINRYNSKRELNSMK